jgi:hypothetical protein
MDIKVKMEKGCYYRNDVWFSPAYQKLTISARDLLQCFWTEIKKREIKKEWKEFENGNLSFTVGEYKQLTGRCPSTYLNARDLLIEVGFIEITHRGGSCRGDRAKYKILFGIKNMSPSQEKWRRYPEENWAKDIPKSKGLTIGKDTRWEKGQCGRKLISHPKRLDPKV